MKRSSPSNGNNQLRTELDRKFQPPIDVLLDPSLLVASNSLDRLSSSNVFDSQAQATLGRQPTEPRIGNLSIPMTFRELLKEEQFDVRNTSVWDFYRGQAKSAGRDDILDTLTQKGISEFSASLNPQRASDFIV